MQREKLLPLLSLLLRPLVRFCLRHGLHIQDLHEAAKGVFVAEAREHLTTRGDDPNISRVSAATGMHRRDVMRIANDGAVKSEPLGLISRVVGQWQYDKRYCQKSGKPRELSCGTTESEFHQLVAALSSDIHAGTVLRELERLGIVERKEGANGERVEQRVKLCSGVVVPSGDVLVSYKLLAKDSLNLYSAVEENIFQQANNKTSEADKSPNLHGTTEFDNIRSEALPKIREWLYSEGSKFHARARDYLSKYDLDIRATGKKSVGGGKVSLTTFSLCSDESRDLSS